MTQLSGFQANPDPFNEGVQSALSSGSAQRGQHGALAQTGQISGVGRQVQDGSCFSAAQVFEGGQEDGVILPQQRAQLGHSLHPIADRVLMGAGQHPDGTS